MGVEKGEDGLRRGDSSSGGSLPFTPQHENGISADELFAAAFDRSRIPMVVATPSGDIERANAAFCDLLGYSSAELQQMSFEDFTATEDLQPSANQLRNLLNGTADAFHFEMQYVSGAGASLPVLVTGIGVRDGTGAVSRVMLQIQDRSPARLAADALDRAQSTDALTGLINRGAFRKALNDALTDRRRSARKLSVLVVNINRFRHINAGMGAAMGDVILREVADRLRGVTRGQDRVGHLGADEFAILASGLNNHDDGIALAIKIRDELEGLYSVGGHSVFASARVGVVTAPFDGADADTLLDRAIIASSTAANNITGGWAVHTPGVDVERRDALALVGDLRRAIDEDGLTVAYQPIVDKEGRLHCLEALARWHHPSRGPVRPNVFIGVAEEAGIISGLTRRVLTAALGHTAAWNSSALPVRVAVNLSGKLLGRPNLVRALEEALATVDLRPDHLTLEITETALVEGDDHKVWEALDALRGTGVRISIDDFGTGYSSLAYLKSLPVDELKIDRSFITDLGSDRRSEPIVRSIIDLAHSLGMPVVAEGIEDDTAAAHVLRLGVDYLQGFGICRPADPTATAEWLRVHPPGLVLPTPQMSHTRRSLHVLVVDDDIVIRATLRARLTEQRHAVVDADGAERALRSIREAMPDLIVLDHLMPGMTGIEVIPLLREAQYGGPILLFTGASPDQLRDLRFPLDVWPVSKSDVATLFHLIDGYACLSETMGPAR